MSGGIFDKNKIKIKIKEFDEKISQENFWNDKLIAQKILKLWIKRKKRSNLLKKHTK